MCGIAGFFSPKTSLDAPHSVLEQMANQLIHRGPDASGVWYNEHSKVGFSHRRLSILDLSSAGSQPMQSASGRYQITFNGEIYNHLDLRKKLETSNLAPQWRGHSDTETLLAIIEAWGIEKCLELSIGMFALALWDQDTQELTLCRDRIGEKPLYYALHNEVLIFGSELTALKAHPCFNESIDHDSIALLMRHNYIPAPYSIYKKTFKLKPGHLLRVSSKDFNPRITAYWSASEQAKINNGWLDNIAPGDYVEMLEATLTQAISRQMLSDVPLGAFLSGGIDSSTIVSLMQKISNSPVKTFTIGFKEKSFNEATYAKAIATHLGTEHHELYLTSKDVCDIIPKIQTLFSEPFADSSQLPTFLVSQLARKNVTVSLSGDGGDELFCGYDRYFKAESYWNRIAGVPLSVRKIIANAIELSAPISSSCVRMLNMSNKNAASAQHRWELRFEKAPHLLRSRDLTALYRLLVSHHTSPSSLLLKGEEPETELTRLNHEIAQLDPKSKLMVLDLISYLPDDILTKVDRTAMGVSLESRVPFLDHTVVELALATPMSIKFHNQETKWPLRQILGKYIPKEIIDRPKMGFAVPIDSWIRDSLRDWAEDLLSERALKDTNIFAPSAVRRLWTQHLSKSANWSPILWNVLMTQDWMRSLSKKHTQETKETIQKAGNA